LHTVQDPAIEAIPIDPATAGIAAGGSVAIVRLGDHDNGPGGDIYQGMVGVFSASSTLLGPANRYRVVDAIDAGAVMRVMRVMRAAVMRQDRRGISAARTRWEKRSTGGGKIRA
jgi:hypothetical protein